MILLVPLFILTTEFLKFVRTQCTGTDLLIVGTRDGYTDGDCVAACPSMYLLTTGQCEACYYTCATCTGLTDVDCDVCLNGYKKIMDARDSFLQGQCESLCPDYYLDKKNGECWACHTSCGSCLDNIYDFNCRSCTNTAEYVLMDYSSINLDTDYGVCQAACPTTNGYVINPTNNKFCYKCQSNCKTCDTANIFVCLSCDPATSPWMYNSKCYTTCPPGSTILDSTAKTCQPCHSSCKTCTGAASNNCDSCDLSGATPYYNIFVKSCTATCPNKVTDAANMICKNCAATCTDCDITLTTCLSCDTTSLTNGWLSVGACIASCPTTSYKKDTIKQICDPCHVSCKTCNGPLSTNCVSCNNSFYLTPTFTCDSSCPAGYTPSSNTCQSCSANCLSCVDSTNCLTCESGFYITSDKRCGRCPEYCGSCNSASNTDCNSCYGGRFLNGKECLPKCPLGRFGKISDFTCYPCHSSCLSCTESSNKDCASCQEGFYLTSDHTCNKCNITCKTCSSDKEDACIQCKTSLYFDEKHICQSNCPFGYFYDINQENCLQCSSKCETCYGVTDNNCASCKVGKFLNPIAKSCDLTCPKRYDNDAGSRGCNSQTQVTPKLTYLESPNVFLLEFPMETSDSARYYQYMLDMYYVKVAQINFDKWKATMERNPKKNGSFYLYFEFIGSSLDTTVNIITLYLPEDNVITSGFYYNIDPEGYKQPPENAGICENFNKYYDKSSKKCSDKSGLDFSLSYAEKQTKFRISFNRDCPTLIQELSRIAYLSIATLTLEEFTFNFTADGSSASSVFLNIYPMQTIVESVYINMTIMINSYISYKDRILEDEIIKSIKMLGYTTISLEMEKLVNDIKATSEQQKMSTYAVVFLCNLMEFGSIYALKTALSSKILSIFKAVPITYPMPLEIVFVQGRILQANEDTWPASFKKYNLSPKLVENCLIELLLFCISLAIAFMLVGLRIYYKKKAAQGANIESSMPKFLVFLHRVFVWNTVIFFWLIFAQNALLCILLNVIYDKNFSDAEDVTTTFILLPMILLTPLHIALILRFGVVDAEGPHGVGYTGVDSHPEADKGSLVVEDYTDEVTQTYFLSLVEPRSNYRIENEGTAFQAMWNRIKKKLMLTLAKLYAQRPPHDKLKASKYLIISQDTDDEKKLSIFYFVFEICRNWLNIILIASLGNNTVKFSIVIFINFLFFVYIYRVKPFKRTYKNVLFGIVEALLNIGVIIVAVLFFISSNPDNDLKNNLAFIVAFVNLIMMVIICIYFLYLVYEYVVHEYPNRKLKAKPGDIN